MIRLNSIVPGHHWRAEFLQGAVQWLHDSVAIWDAQTCSDLTLSENQITRRRKGTHSGALAAR